MKRKYCHPDQNIEQQFMKSSKKVSSMKSFRDGSFLVFYRNCSNFCFRLSAVHSLLNQIILEIFSDFPHSQRSWKSCIVQQLVRQFIYSNSVVNNRLTCRDGQHCLNVKKYPIFLSKTIIFADKYNVSNLIIMLFTFDLKFQVFSRVT